MPPTVAAKATDGPAILLGESKLHPDYATLIDIPHNFDSIGTTLGRVFLFVDNKTTKVPMMPGNFLTCAPWTTVTIPAIVWFTPESKKAPCALTGFKDYDFVLGSSLNGIQLEVVPPPFKKRSGYKGDDDIQDIGTADIIGFTTFTGAIPAGMGKEWDGFWAMFAGLQRNRRRAFKEVCATPIPPPSTLHAFTHPFQRMTQTTHKSRRYPRRWQTCNAITAFR